MAVETPKEKIIRAIIKIVSNPSEIREVFVRITIPKPAMITPIAIP